MRLPNRRVVKGVLAIAVLLGLVLLAIGWSLVLSPPHPAEMVGEAERPEVDQEELDRRLRPIIESLQKDLAAQEAPNRR
jgi:hypothetical protein